MDMDQNGIMKRRTSILWCQPQVTRLGQGNYATANKHDSLLSNIVVANMGGSHAHNRLVDTLNFATDQGAGIVIAMETKLSVKAVLTLQCATLMQEWMVKKAHDSDWPQGSSVMVAVHPCLVSHICCWATHGSYVVAFSLHGCREYWLWIVGVYVPPQERSVRDTVLTIVCTKIEHASKCEEQVLLAGDLNKCNDTLPHPFEATATANGLIDLAVHLDAMVSMHSAGGRLDCVYLTPAVSANILAMSVVAAHGFDHSCLVLHTMIALHVDCNLACT